MTLTFEQGVTIMTPAMLELIAKVLNDHISGSADDLCYSVNDLSESVQDAELIGYTLEKGYFVKQPEAPVVRMTQEEYDAQVAWYERMHARWND
jgi:hypothetical protein